MCLRDLLPEAMPNARVLTYGYNARTRGNASLSDQKLHSHGQDLITSIAAQRKAHGVSLQNVQ
jgi:hypothetical protein